MLKLTQEQIKTLEDTFSSYPEEFSASLGDTYTTMDGISEQIGKLNNSSGYIFYAVTESDYIEPNKLKNHYSFKLRKMFIGNEAETEKENKETISLENREALMAFHGLTDQQIDDEISRLIKLSSEQKLQLN